MDYNCSASTRLNYPHLMWNSFVLLSLPSMVKLLYDYTSMRVIPRILSRWRRRRW